MAILYIHKKKNNGEVFYVGIGKCLKRAYQKKFRNKHWKNIASKYGYDVEVLKQDITWDDACSMERDLIKKYGRKIDGGTLCNITTGGDGVVGVAMTDEHKRKISESNTGKKRTHEARLNISKARMGIVFTDEHRANISKSKVGKKKSDEFRLNRSKNMSMGNHTLAKQVIDLYTGIFYSCIKEACIANNCNYSREVQRIRNNSKKKRFELI